MEDYKEITKEAYNKYPEIFIKKFDDLYQGAIVPHFQKFKDLLPGKKILDLGCGSGSHIPFLQENDFEVLGIDNSEKMIEICNKKGFNVKIGDIEDLNLKENSFDGIWASMSLIHVQKSKLSSIAKSLKTILKPKGILFISVKEGDGENIASEKEEPDAKRFTSYWREKELTGNLDGFNLIESSKISMPNRNYLYFYLINKK